MERLDISGGLACLQPAIEHLQGSGQCIRHLQLRPVPNCRSAGKCEGISKIQNEREEGQGFCDARRIKAGGSNPCWCANEHSSASSIKSPDSTPLFSLKAPTRVPPRVSQEVEISGLSFSLIEGGTESSLQDANLQVEKVIQEDTKLHCYFPNPSGYLSPLRAIQDSGARVSVARKSIWNRGDARATEADSPLIFTSASGEQLELTHFTWLDLRLSCFEQGRMIRVKFFFLEDEKLAGADAFLSVCDAMSFGHLFILHCNTHTDEKADRSRFPTVHRARNQSPGRVCLLFDTPTGVYGLNLS